MKALTLVELLVVLGIIALLLTISVGTYQKVARQQRLGDTLFCLLAEHTAARAAAASLSRRVYVSIETHPAGMVVRSFTKDSQGDQKALRTYRLPAGVFIWSQRIGYDAATPLTSWYEGDGTYSEDSAYYFVTDAPDRFGTNAEPEARWAAFDRGDGSLRYLTVWGQGFALARHPGDRHGSPN